MIRGLVLVACAAALVAAPAAASFQTPAVPQTTPPVFRGGIDLVPIAVSVLGRDGHPVADLKASDFLVLEDGAPQPIVTFGAVNLPVPPRPAAGAAGPPALVPSDVATNAPHDGRVFLLVLDDMLIPDDLLMERTTKELARRVIDRLGPDDLMSVIFTRDNGHAEDFTADKARLYAAVDHFTAGTAYMLGNPNPYQLDAPIGVISQAVDFLAGIRERRKALVYISEGSAVDPEEAVGIGPASQWPDRMMHEMTGTFQKAARANVAVYSFVPSPDGTEGALTRMFLSEGVDAATAMAAAHAQTELTDDFLESYASNTNGRAVLNATNADAGIDRMFEEMSVYYVIGYRSANSRPGTYRRIQVKVTRPGSYDVRTVGQYYMDNPRSRRPSRCRPRRPRWRAFSRTPRSRCGSTPRRSRARIASTRTSRW